MNKIIKVLLSFIFTLSFVLMNNFTYAASVSMYANSKNLTVGKSTNIVVSGNKSFVGKFSISSSDSNVVSLDDDSVWVDIKTNGEDEPDSCIAHAKSVGTATITINPVDVSRLDPIEDVTSSIGSRSIKITVSKNQTTIQTPKVTTNDNASLKSLTIENFNIEPEFSKNILQYNLKVDSSINDLNITATADDSNASVDITGNKDLKEGDNTVKITVTATDKKTTKEYTIAVNKAQDQSKVYLKSLTLSEGKLVPNFKEDIFNYNLTDVSDDVNSIDVKAVPKFNDSKVEINGADNLSMNNNKITIKVTSSDNKITKTYIISVSRSQEYYESLKNSKLSFKDKIINFFTNQKKLIIILYAFILIEFLQILYLYSKVRKIDNNEEISNKNEINKNSFKDSDKNIKANTSKNENIIKNSVSDSKNEFENHIGRRRGSIRGNYKDKF